MSSKKTKVEDVEPINLDSMEAQLAAIEEEAAEAARAAEERKSKIKDDYKDHAVAELDQLAVRKEAIITRLKSLGFADVAAEYEPKPVVQKARKGKVAKATGESTKKCSRCGAVGHRADGPKCEATFGQNTLSTWTQDDEDKVLAKKAAKG